MLLKWICVFEGLLHTRKVVMVMVMDSTPVIYNYIFFSFFSFTCFVCCEWLWLWLMVGLVFHWFESWAQEEVKVIVVVVVGFGL